MHQSIHFSGAANTALKVTVLDPDRKSCWIDFRSDDNNEVTIFVTREHLVELSRLIEIELREPESVCDYAGCNEPITTNVVVMVGDGDGGSEGDYCHEHAREAAMHAYQSGNVSSIKLVPIAS